MLLAMAWIPSRASAQQSEETVRLEGIVLDKESNAPVSRVRVVLVPVEGSVGERGGPLVPLSSPNATVLTTNTGDDGRFSFPKVIPGAYQLAATHDGYTRSFYEGQSNSHMPPMLQLIARQPPQSITLSMTRTGTISGKIKNSYGEPMGNVMVEAHQSTVQGGASKLSSVLQVLTNDLGEYRMYYLPPGQYFVSANPAIEPQTSPDGNIYVEPLATLPGSPLSGNRDLGRTMSASDLAAMGIVRTADTGETYLQVYYPGTTDLAMAAPIDLKPGATFSNADFVVRKTRAVRVRGKVTNGIPGMPLSKASVFLMSNVTGHNFGLAEVRGKVLDSGEFEFRGVTPGNYDLVATMGDLPQDFSFPGSGYPGGAILETFSFPGLTRRNPAPRAPRLMVKTSIQVGNADVTNIALQLGEGFKLSGKISIEGKSAAESNALTAGIRIQLVPDPETFETAPFPSEVGPDGTFTVSALISGTYQIAIMDADKLESEDPYVKSVTYENQDAINPRLVVSAEPRSTLDIELSSIHGALAASVKNARQDPADGVTVAVVPAAPRHNHFELYQLERTDNEGKTYFQLPPGDYTVYAWEKVGEEEWMDPAFLQKYEGLGKLVHISAEKQQSLDLSVSPMK